MVNCKVSECFKSNNVLKNVILCYDEFKIKKLSNQIFIYNNGFKNKSLFIEELIKQVLDESSKSSLDYDDIIFVLNEKYNLNFDFYSFDEALEGVKFETLFKSQEMEKIYLNIDYYYKEVFGNNELY